MLKVLVFFCLQALVHSQQGADVVLSCSLIEDGGGMMGGSLFTRTPATLVLRNIAVTSDPSQDTVTPYNPPDSPNKDDLIFEVTVLSVEIPEAESLLHADCNEQEVECELSRYVPRGTKPDAQSAHFISSIQVVGGDIGLTLVLQTISSEKAESSTPPLMQSKLQVPLSQWGTLLTEAVFVVFSRSPSLAAPLGDDALLDCGYRQKDPSQNQDIGLEWRWQYKGNGRRVLEMKTQEVESEERTQEVQVEREGVSADSVLLIRDGNASLTMKKLKVSDEGTYICTISIGAFQTQQIIQLHITKPPQVFFSEKKVMFQDESPQKLSCHCERYYPLDVHVEWISQPPSETEAISMTEKASLSSHRQHSDGTYSLSSFLVIRPADHPPGTVVTCRVSHFALQTPSDISLTVEPPEPAGNYYWMVLATLILSGLYLYQASR